MPELVAQVLTPTVVAAVVSGSALVARELVTWRWRRRESSLQHQTSLAEQIRLLWHENGALRGREAACERRYRMLERRCGHLERASRRLRQRLHRLGQVLGARRRGRRPPRSRA